MKIWLRRKKKKHALFMEAEFALLTIGILNTIITSPYAKWFNVPTESNSTWWALWDISQQYVDLHINTYLLDSLTLTIDYVGATEFTDMYPEPDLKTMSSIQFTDQDKIELIKQNGLQFHVKFKELENRQNVRLFFLTAIMGSLFVIFIVFAIVGLYKLRLWFKEIRTTKRSNQQEKENKLQIENKNDAEEGTNETK
ncbi:MAG: hypothetical protein IJ841_08425 [Prevotella sp.]|nr:hypothetical protein [Prevotella sp.]